MRVTLEPVTIDNFEALMDMELPPELKTPGSGLENGHF